MIQYGDKHNFGQQVKTIERASGTWFQKPRSVFWEYLFFGKSSPLREFFFAFGQNGRVPISNYFFNLEVEDHNNWFGFSKKVDFRPSVLKTEELFYSFGALLAYCYIFGIQDLHKFNVVETHTHLQVIDAEAVLSNLTLPNETLLLPFKSVDHSTAAMDSIAASYKNFRYEQVKALFAGYYDLCSILLRQTNEIKTVVRDAVPAKTPIRVILRNTAKYTDMLASRNFPGDLLHEEAEQLNRGDVPYFFKFIGTENLYWINQKGNVSTTVKKLGVFDGDVRRSGSSLDILLGEKSDLEKRMHQGGLFLLMKLKPAEEFKLQFQSDDLLFRPDAIVFPSKNSKLSYK
ncbi:MAG: type 2 lantipeptide synthetase LanM [Bdellovibrionales bacterium]|nr:type 2 lantipeptide synthetase LanM [Bdellovibrionales bacterium]